ncbi:unnamed protein product, partial [Vitis vinifera]|uniref:Uncharacterized protein n=1 Tax=Vitis vinifera TaxID=29760 RepID=D7UB07_VITVI
MFFLAFNLFRVQRHPRCAFCLREEASFAKMLPVSGTLIPSNFRENFVVRASILLKK